MKNLNRKIGIFKECLIGDEQKPSGFLNAKLKNVLDAQKVVETTFDLVSLNIAELTSIMCEMQHNIQLSEAQVKELKDEVEEQEKKYTKEGMKMRSQSERVTSSWSNGNILLLTLLLPLLL